jgi:hypothetical protein
MSESVNISGNVNTVIVNNGEPTPQDVGEQFVADISYNGSIHRVTLRSKNGIPTREALGEHLQSDYPGAIVQMIYTVDTSNNNPYEISDSKRYHPSKLDWV